MSDKQKKSFKERLADKRKELASRGGKGNIIFLKDGDTLRVRIVNTGDEKDFIFEVTQFYLGGDQKGIFSPSTFGMPCALMEKYEELKTSKNREDKILAKTLVPKKKNLILPIIYTDLKGNTVDTEKTGKLIQLGSSAMAAEILDFFLDEEEWGDFMDEKDGYDFKLGRTGSGKFDTEYTVKPCKPSPIPREWKGKIVDLEAAVRAIMPSYEETEEALATFLANGPESHDDHEDDEKEARRERKERKEGKRNRDV